MATKRIQAFLLRPEITDKRSVLTPGPKRGPSIRISGGNFSWNVVHSQRESVGEREFQLAGVDLDIKQVC